MKTFTVHSLAAILMLGLTTLVSAQDDPAKALQEFQKHSLEEERSKVTSEMYAAWNDDDSRFKSHDLLYIHDFREGIGVSNEQHRNILESAGQRISIHSNEIPATVAIREEMQKLREGIRSPFHLNAPEDAKRRMAELEEQIQVAMHDRTLEIKRENTINAINEHLTPDQLRKVQEFQIFAMSELSYISPSMFEALDLSDDQRQQLGDIKKGMEPDFKKWVDRTVDAKLKFFEKRLAEYKMEIDDTDSEHRKVTYSLHNIPEVEAKIRKAHPEIQRELNESMESGKELAGKLKIEMFDVLTDEQWERMLNLIDNPPEYAKKIIARMRERGEKENANASTGTWVPGPGAWQPGSSAIPEQYRQERNSRSRFPRGER